MATKTRGKVLNQVDSRARGLCPICGRTGIKLLYEGQNSDGTTVSVCKYCRPVKTLKKNSA